LQGDKPHKKKRTKHPQPPDNPISGKQKSRIKGKKKKSHMSLGTEAITPLHPHSTQLHTDATANAFITVPKTQPAGTSTSSSHSHCLSGKRRRSS
jgi:hypothetical protein